MLWIYLSPHLDDVALSCGGLLWEQAQIGEAPAVWTVCAGDPPDGALSGFAEELHQRWGVERDAIQARRREDATSCALLGADYRHFPLPDCIYRPSPHSGQALYASEGAIFGEVHPDESALVAELTRLLAKQLPPGTAATRYRIVCPLALGGHVDHRLIRIAAERLGHPLWYYADYPYVVRHSTDLPARLPPGWVMVTYPVSPAGLRAWVESVAAHRTQISTFWGDVAAMADAIRDYARQSGGVRLWRPPQPFV